jgi:hypothetical protein
MLDFLRKLMVVSGGQSEAVKFAATWEKPFQPSNSARFVRDYCKL